MARRRRPAPTELDDAVPEWFWEFDGTLWGWHAKNLRLCRGQIEGHHAARTRWHTARREWLEERGLVASDSVSWSEFKRIEREEPHRVLRHQDPPAV
jgi:hypothetical protein